MDRRAFIRRLGPGVLAACFGWGWPARLRAAGAFDHAVAGQDLIQRGQFRQALVRIEEALRLDPRSDWAYGLMGRAYRGLGRFPEAVAAFRSALRLNPQDGYSRMMIDIMTQKPLAKIEKPKAPLSPLERQALQEERDMLATLDKRSGLYYQVKRVVIDAGHGGFDPGAVGPGGLREKEVTLDMALRLHQRLKRSGSVQSFLTRTGDYYIPLSARTVSANQHQADLFISLHVNAHQSSAPNGSETYYCSEKASSEEARKVASYENSVLKYDDPSLPTPGHIDIEEILMRFERRSNWVESGNFAQRFQQRFKQRLPLKSRGVHSANFFVLRRAQMPSILLETGFISNPAEEKLLARDEFRDRIVAAVAEGLA